MPLEPLQPLEGDIISAGASEPADLLPEILRNHEGLTLAQRAVLVNLLEEPDLETAARRASIEIKTVRGWLRKDKNFLAAYNDLGGAILAETRARLDMLMPNAADVMAEALGATEVQLVTVTIPCPHKDDELLPCDKQHTIDVLMPTPDWTTRWKIAEALLKRSGDLGTSKVKVEVGGSVDVKHRNLDMEDRIAIRQIERGVPVPPDVRESLRQRRLLPESASPTTR